MLIVPDGPKFTFVTGSRRVEQSKKNKCSVHMYTMFLQVSIYILTSECIGGDILIITVLFYQCGL